LVVTEKAVFAIENGTMVLKEIAEDTNLEEIRRLTEARFEVAADVMPMLV
jgi:acyl CoA:acetate/3-ketoacid CoA transferase beta subunit